MSENSARLLSYSLGGGESKIGLAGLESEYAAFVSRGSNRRSFFGFEKPPAFLGLWLLPTSKAHHSNLCFCHHSSFIFPPMILLPPLNEDSCDYVESIWVIQQNLPTSRSCD